MIKLALILWYFAADFLIDQAVYKYAVEEINIFAIQCSLWIAKSEQSRADFSSFRESPAPVS